MISWICQLKRLTLSENQKSMSTTYIWQEEEWPHFTWNNEQIARLLGVVHQELGRLTGIVSMFGFEQKTNTCLDAMTQEIVHSAEIEGERLDHDSVRSSVARQLGLPYAGLPRVDHYVEGVVQIMLDATQHAKQPLTDERLFGWHAALFPTGYSGAYKITVANWRQSPEAMQVVSGAMGHYQVHFEAPPSQQVPGMMKSFLEWVSASNAVDPLIKAAILHLWFVTIHPFDDGNGRLCRTITEMMLARADGMEQRYYSLSSAILNNRKSYYEQLEQTQKGGLDITAWIAWFLTTLHQAVATSIDKADRVKQKTNFWDRHAGTDVNERQRKVINRLWDGFEGKLNSSKWAKMCHCSQDTALRDIHDLIEKGILRDTGEGGRSKNYELIDMKILDNGTK
jgi:Fic family protein